MNRALNFTEGGEGASMIFYESTRIAGEVDEIVEAMGEEACPPTEP